MSTAEEVNADRRCLGFPVFVLETRNARLIMHDAMAIGRRRRRRRHRRQMRDASFPPRQFRSWELKQRQRKGDVNRHSFRSNFACEENAETDLFEFASSFSFKACSYYSRRHASSSICAAPLLLTLLPSSAFYSIHPKAKGDSIKTGEDSSPQRHRHHLRVVIVAAAAVTGSCSPEPFTIWVRIHVGTVEHVQCPDGMQHATRWGCNVVVVVAVPETSANLNDERASRALSISDSKGVAIVHLSSDSKVTASSQSSSYSSCSSDDGHLRCRLRCQGYDVDRARANEACRIHMPSFCASQQLPFKFCGKRAAKELRCGGQQLDECIFYAYAFKTVFGLTSSPTTTQNICHQRSFSHATEGQFSLPEKVPVRRHNISSAEKRCGKEGGRNRAGDA